MINRTPSTFFRIETLRTMKPFYRSALCLLIFGLLTSPSFAQSFYLKLVELTNTPTTYEVEVQMALSSAGKIGSSNLQFSYDPAFIDNPVYVSTSLTEPIYTVSASKPAAGVASLNIFLAIPGIGDNVNVFPTFSSVGVISFDKQGGSPADLTWLYNGGTTETVAYIDDESTQIFAATPASDLQGLTPTSGLPFEMSYFNAHWENETELAALITWGTETETQTGHFEVQRSFDAIRFNQIGTVEAAGNSTDPQFYQFIDKELDRMQGDDVVYYRLREVDQLGEDTFTEIRALTKKRSEAKLRAYPSPFENEISIHLHGPDWIGKNLEIQLTNNIGSVVKQFEVWDFQSYTLQLIDLNGIDPGMYFLSVRTIGAQKWETVKVLKL